MISYCVHTGTGTGISLMRRTTKTGGFNTAQSYGFLQDPSVFFQLFLWIFRRQLKNVP
jgi:hypothetical protein